MLRSRLISIPGACVLVALLLLCGYAYGVWRGIVPLYPPALARLVPAALLEQGKRPPAAPAAAAEPESAPAPLEDVWASDPATGPVIDEPGLRRSCAVAPRHCRLLTGEVKAVSPSQGLLVVLPPDIGGDGVIAPATLIPDFHRRFRVGEKIAVAVKGISMKGSRKQVELLLVGP
ncbi:MAG: hypothetical protein BWY57_02774 [Betaproteobacteria bacterium ADurb.Bin341]|nr:MAG: hypothetical protein BWY57_02774 [Betaproteobacteria bacterium ADurb.Bin341]